jgi:large subunit ribosomal protein L19
MILTIKPCLKLLKRRAISLCNRRDIITTTTSSNKNKAGVVLNNNSDVLRTTCSLFNQGQQIRYFGYENYPKWPPYTLDKHGQVKQKKLTKQAGFMLSLIEEELAEKSTVSKEKVINVDFNVGDAIEVNFYNNFSVKKMQKFTGIVIAKRNRGVNSSFTVRNVIFGMGVERQFPLYMPLLQEIKVLTKRVIHKGKRDGKKVRRAKLYYLRDRPASQSTVSIKLTKTEKAEKLKIRMKMKRDRKKAKKKK